LSEDEAGVVGLLGSEHATGGRRVFLQCLSVEQCVRYVAHVLSRPAGVSVRAALFHQHR
jgi:hypothetical protein